MKYLNFYQAQGRLANHFYFALQAFKYSKICQTQYLTDLQFMHQNDLFRKLQFFGLDKYISIKNDVSQSDIIDIDTTHNNWWNSWHQLFFIDFDLELLEEFVKKEFIQSGKFRQNMSNIIGLHIRRGDYKESKISNCFDKQKYIDEALRYLQGNTIKVFSDDIHSAEQYLSKYRENYTILFSENATDIDDFLELSQLKQKILWNSTFSYWSAFISNVLYPNSYKCICCPARFSSVEPIGDHCNPLWNNIIS